MLGLEPPAELHLSLDPLGPSRPEPLHLRVALPLRRPAAGSRAEAGPGRDLAGGTAALRAGRCLGIAWQQAFETQPAVTSVHVDRQVAHQLSKVVGICLRRFVRRVLHSGSDQAPGSSGAAAAAGVRAARGEDVVPEVGRQLRPGAEP